MDSAEGGRNSVPNAHHFLFTCDMDGIRVPVVALFLSSVRCSELVSVDVKFVSRNKSE